MTSDPFELFWRSKPLKFREKWAIRMQSGLSPKRKFQLTRQMAEFFARQGEDMEAIAKAKRAEFQNMLDQNIKTAATLEFQLQDVKRNIEQLRGAVTAMDKLLSAKDAKPELKLVETPAATPNDPGIA